MQPPTGAGFVIPGAGLLGAAGRADPIDGQAYDGPTAKILAGFTAHETDDTALLNTAQFSWYHSSRRRRAVWRRKQRHF